jgi:hypothetical protein
VPTLADVYQKFGETAEAAQLLETELGNTLLLNRGFAEGLFEAQNPERASDLLATINRNTLGQLIAGFKKESRLVDVLDALLTRARDERNRLFHSFYRQHNFRRNSDEGRAVMLDDLESIYDTLIDAYNALLALSPLDLKVDFLPTKHQPI